jgi:hypothetical protein
MKKLQAMLSLVLLFSLLFATTNVFAGAQSVKKDTFKGAVTAAGNGSLTLSLANGHTITFVVNGDTKVKVPGLGANATLADVKAGMQATVQAVETEVEDEGEEKDERKGKDEKEEKETWTALYIHVVPAKPEKVHRVGVVTEYVAGARISILAKDGKAYTFAITSDSKITPPRRAGQLGMGARVAIIGSREAARTEWTARSIVIYSIATPVGTKTPMPPTATASATTVPPTATHTQLPPTATSTSVPPTATNTQLPPTATATATSIPPTATNTSVPPTATNTQLPPTATATSAPPTATNTSAPPTATTAPITWNGYAGPLFATKCTMCHGTIAGVTLNTYQNAMATGSIIPGDPANSKLVKVQQKGNHPGQLNADELSKVIAWIQAGAPEK